MKSGTGKERYIRLPHWAEVKWRVREEIDNAYSFELKAMEHRASEAALRIPGFAFETTEEPPMAACIQLEIRLSEDTLPARPLVRVVNIESDDAGGPFRVEGNFLATGEKDMKELAQFVRKYF